MEHSAGSRFCILSGSALKLIAVVTMLIDHIGAFLLAGTPTGNTLLFSAGTMTLYELTRLIGRTAFPIYCFLISEGYRYTHDRKKYGIQLLAFSLISEIPWNLVHTGSLLYEKQNVFFTLLLGYLCICVCETFRKKPEISVGCFAVLITAALCLKSDYGIKGVALVLVFHIVNAWIPQMFIGISLMNVPWKEIPAFLLIRMYNGKRGFIRGKCLKYLFYLFYPLHLFALYLIKFQ